MLGFRNLGKTKQFYGALFSMQGLKPVFATVAVLFLPQPDG
jgi:hypothetical protein